MAGNLIEVGAVVDLGQYKAGMQEAVATTQAATQEISASFEQAHVKTRTAMAGMAFAVEDSGIKVSRHFRHMLAEIPLVNAAFTTLMPLLALGVGIDILKRVGEKLSEIVSETFIFTEAMKKEEAAIKTTNTVLVEYASRIKQIGREMQLAATTSAAEKEKLRLQFTLDDLGGNPDKLRAKMDAAIAELAHAKQELANLNSPLQYAKAVGDPNTDFTAYTKSIDEAKSKIGNLENAINIYSNALKVAEAETAKAGQAIDKDLGEAADKQQKAFRKMRDSIRAEMDDKAANHQRDVEREIQLTLHGIETENTAIARGANDQLRTWDEAYKGEIESARQNTEVKVQLIEQEFLKGKITQQQEIAAIAQAKQAELAQEIKFHQLRIALWEGDKKEIQRIENEITKAQQQANVIRAKAATDSLKAQEQNYRRLFEQIGGSFKTEILSMVSGTETVAQGFAKMYNSIIAGLAEQVSQKAIKKAEEWAIEEIFGKKKAAANVAQATSNVGVAAANALASVPWPFNIAAAAETEGVGTGFEAQAAVAFFAQGTNFVPQDGLAYLHKGEEIIPASKQGQGYSGSGGGDIHVHVKLGVVAMDSESFHGTIKKHSNIIGNEVARALKKKGIK